MLFHRQRAVGMLEKSGFDALVVGLPVSVAYVTEHESSFERSFRGYMFSPEGRNERAFRSFAVLSAGGYVESFNGHLRRELLELESFNSLYEAQVLLEDWRREYDHHRPHQSLGYQTPAAFAHQWHAPHQPAPS
jgi:Integrase core domain